MSGGRDCRAHEACLALVVAVTSLLAGCVVQMYPGPKLPREETARIEADHASVTNIDGMDLPVGSAFMVRSGLHVMSATMLDADGHWAGRVTFCFAAEGGASYILRSWGQARRDAALIDARTSAEIQVRPLEPGERCVPADRPRPVVVKAPDLPPPVAPAETATAAAAEEAGADAASSPADAPAAPPSDAAVRAPAAVEGEAPRRGRPLRATYASRQAAEPQPRWLRHPGNGLMFDFGAFMGGTDLATATFTDGSTSSLSGGSGILLSAGLMLTPLWVGDGAGFGLDAFASVKFDSIGTSGNSVSLTRYPLGLGAHVLAQIDDRWWFILRGGIIKETGITLSADGYGDASLSGSLGGFGEGGVYYVLHAGNDHVAFVWTFRYSGSSDSANGAKISANSGGLIWALHINL